MTFREVLARLRGLVGRGRDDREHRDEMAFHLEMLEARHRGLGLDERAARRAARLELGAPSALEEAWRDQRGLPFLDALRQDVRYGFRMLRKSPGFTAAALLTLAIGIGATTAVFSIFDTVLLRPLPYADADRLVLVGDRSPDKSVAGVGLATAVDWRERSRSFAEFAMFRLWIPTLVDAAEAERLAAARVSWNYFDVLGWRPALGRGFLPEDDRESGWHVALLSDRLWRRRFGADPSTIGRMLDLNGQSIRVIGIMPAAFEALDAQRYFGAAADIWVPLGNDQADCRLRCRPVYGIGRLKPGVAVADASAELQAIREQLRREHPRDYAAGAVSVMSMRDALTAHVRPALSVLLAAVSFVLLVACANVANLLLARSVTRGRELSLRAALGAGRGRIARQLLTESLLLATGGALGGVLLAEALVRGVASIAPVTLPRLELVAIDGRVLLFAAVLAVVTTVLVGVAPALRGGVAEPRSALSVNGRASAGGRSRARALLVVVDLALALVLLAGAGVMIRTVAALTRVSPGFDASRVLTLQFSLTGRSFRDEAAMVAFQQRAVERIGTIPGVARVALAGQIPFARAGAGAGTCWRFYVAGRMAADPTAAPCIEHFSITPDYFDVLRIPVLSGRAFTERDASNAQPVVLISQAAARMVWGTADPIGAQIRMGNAARGPWRTVVGVVGDVRSDDLTDPVMPAFYTPETQFTSAYLTAVVRATGDDAAAVAGPVRHALRELDPSVPVYGVATLASLLDKTSADRSFVMRLLAAFAGIAVLLAAIGLYGVVSYGVEQRTREVGVRVALGARRADVLRLVLGGGVRLVAIGVFAGVTAGLAATRFLGSLVFGVSPTDPLTFAAAAALLAFVGLLAHWIPVRRALRIDPATALRAE